ncbi:MAG: oxygen-independent coproporphyrinogen III oxidase [Candidatus Sericytochromatia bacterium]|nr:oxygen-independent coproporphyrinogen III oxidase [Candidatus Sericytochromatia bacterium]
MSPPASPYRVPRDLLERYAQSGPRYTSYPTAPEWSSDFGPDGAREALARNSVERAGVPLSLYVHIPFCEKLCFYCGCNIQLNKDRERVKSYLDAVEREVEAVAAQVDTARPVVQLHWGGGTPTHLLPEEIERLHGMLFRHFRLAEGAEVSLEVHPNVTTSAQVETLARLGFNRISMGVQDFDPVVQKAVNRLQSFELTRDLVELCRAQGFISVNLDLMYGLPEQTWDGFVRTLDQVLTIAPDRLALFHYAHLPSVFSHQRNLKNLPDSDLKLRLFERAIDTFVAEGMTYIGMDHFARPDNELSRAREDGSLRRNFMGYTTCADSDLLSFGMSAISDLEGAYYQNQRTLSDYMQAMTAGTSPAAKGMHLSADDRLRRDVINTIIGHGRLDKARIEARHGIRFHEAFALEWEELAVHEADGLVRRRAEALEVTPVGQMLIRNICMVFDAYLRRAPERGRIFSKTL